MADDTMKNKSGKGSEETIAKLTQNMVTSLTTKTFEDNSLTRILVLVSTTSGSRRQLSHQERSIAMLEALEIPFETLNCAMPENRKRRDELFEISDVRGDFPQFFLLKSGEDNETPRFLGQFDDMETCNENSNLPVGDPSLKETDLTWDRIMDTNKKYNNKGVSLDGGVDDDSEASDGSGGGGGIYADL